MGAGRAEIVIAGRLFLDGAFSQASLGITDGKIVSIAKVLQGDRVLDVGDAWVLPGLVDLHVHFREPGLTHKEDFRSGTTAAAVGGVTTVLEMPNTLPPTTTPEAAIAKRERAARSALVDFGIYGGVVPGSDLAALCAQVSALKVYAGRSTGGLLLRTEGFAGVFSQPLPVPIAVHAEDEGILEEHLTDDGPSDLVSHDHSRPAEAELAAVRHILATRPRQVHIAHLSEPRTLELLASTSHTCEVTPSHLLLHTGMESLGTAAKMNPPIRSKAVRDRLWELYLQGALPIVASDHAPHAVQEKGMPFATAPSGINGVETMGPLLLHRLRHDGLDAARIIDSLTSNPAKAFGLAKGRLQVGADADILIIEPSASRTIKGSGLHGKCPQTPFEGAQGLFPSVVLVRGTTVVEGGEPVGAPGTGRFVRPSGPLGARGR